MNDRPDIDEYAPYMETAVAAARLAGDALVARAREGFRIEQKTSVVNLVTDADHEAERIIIDRILSEFPSHHILAEEGGRDTRGESSFQWVIDPLDGTTNYAHGFPCYSVSIGLEHNGFCVLGVVLDPTRDDLFTAAIGQGARLNGQPISVSSIASLDEALLVTGFAYDIRDNPNNNLDHFCRFSLRAQGVRRTGSAALDLCYVAMGRLDGYWEVKLSPWDSAAGGVILREAGGRVTHFNGAPHTIYGRDLVASNGHLHEAMLRVLAEGSGGPAIAPT